MTNYGRCQAKNPAACTDPNCPEKRGVHAALRQATTNRDYNAYAKARDAEQRMRQRAQTQYEEKLFHTELGFPSNFTPPKGVRPLEYSRHAEKAALDDRYGYITLPPQINLDNFELIELGVVDGNKVSKMLYRGSLDGERDICIVVIPKPKGQKWFVKTVWINERNDSHRTLNRNKYVVPQRTV